MTSLRMGATTWLLSPKRETRLRPARRSVVGVFGRTLAVMAATGALGFTTLASAPRAELPKQGVVIEGAGRPADAPARHAGALALSPFQSSPLGGATAFRPALPAASDGFAQPSQFPAEWREEEFASVTVADGRTLIAGDLRIRLLGLDVPLPEQVCRTLDGRLELCAVRASTQLELLTRWKRVACQVRRESAGEAVGRCRIGTSDLAERMIKTGYTWRSAAAPQG